MAKVTLIDAGPLVAAAVTNERHHRWAADVLRSLHWPLTTCEAVLTEACFLLSRWPAAVDALMLRVETKQLRLEPMSSEAAALRALMKKYRSVPMSYADACLVRLTEREPSSVLVTLDTDFAIYRRNGRQTIPLRAPFRELRRV
jgi:predicted nucleic acid-binding protein